MSSTQAAVTHAAVAIVALMNEEVEHEGGGEDISILV
jgi:hypothetical protein